MGQDSSSEITTFDHIKFEPQKFNLSNKQQQNNH